MDVLSSFGVEWKLLIASVINFVILLYLLNKILYRPLLTALDERRAKIAESIENAEQIEQKLAETTEKEKEILRKSRLEAESLMARAEDHARTRESELLDQAEERARAIVRRAEEKMGQQASVMRQEIEQNVADLVIEATRTILRENIPPNLTKEYATRVLKAAKP